MHDQLLLDARLDARRDEVPDGGRHAHGLPVPDLRAGAEILAVAGVHQFRWELFSQPRWQSAEDGRVRARVLAAFGDGDLAGWAVARVLAANDVERLEHIVHLDWTRRDAPVVR